MLKGIAIVGIGLIGGSVGLAARTRKLTKQVIGIGRSREKLELAVRLGAIDRFSLDFDPIIECDLVVVCTPVGQIAQDVLVAAKSAKPGTLIVDAGSTKANLARELENGLPQSVEFVGCHPIAGSQRSGVEAAKADLFENRLTVITPTATSSHESIQKATQFWRSLGSHTLEVDPLLHDEILATTSHLPHLFASVLAMTTPQDWLEFTGGGWRDSTRIAAGEPTNWTQIFLANREMLLKSLSRAEQQIAAIRHAIEINDASALKQLLIKGKEHRDALGD